MKSTFVGGAALFIIGLVHMSATDFETITVPGVVVTGVRSTSASTDDVVITASYTTGGVTTGALYSGSLAAAPGAPAASWVQLNPTFAGQTITSSTLYGPNTSLFTPEIGVGNVTAVGSYKYNEGASGASFNHGLIYSGSVLGGGTFLQIDATPLVGVGESLLNTIAHSNMGDIVVGNYDTNIATGKAFIYNMATATWTNLNPSGSKSVTAYGIWQNSSTSFTIAGGQSDVTSLGLDEGFLVNYDSSTGLLEYFKTFNFNNQPLSALVSHFDGITVAANGFNLTGDYLTTGGDMGAFFASVTILPGGGFSEATWTNIDITGSAFTSGNTVVGNNVLGIYDAGDGVFSYIATVPEPASGTLLCMAGLFLAASRRRK